MAYRNGIMAEETKEKKLFLLDAYALIFRAYYAFIKNPRINSKGLNTSAIFGFTNTLLDLLDKQKPTHIAVVFDHKSENVRKQEYKEYKANRDATPEDIKLSEPYIRQIIEGFNIPILFAKSTAFLRICIFTSNFGKTFTTPSVIIKGLSSLFKVMCHTWLNLFFPIKFKSLFKTAFIKISV